MRSAIPLHMTTFEFAFLVDDAVFSLPSVLIIDGGEVLAVQKFTWCRRGVCCVHFPQCWLLWLLSNARRDHCVVLSVTYSPIMSR